MSDVCTVDETYFNIGKERILATKQVAEEES